jgi:hypothetical protein
MLDHSWAPARTVYARLYAARLAHHTLTWSLTSSRKGTGSTLTVNLNFIFLTPHTPVATRDSDLLDSTAADLPPLA